MNIAVLGTGSVGQALAVKLHELGHQVYMGTRNVRNSLQKTGKDTWGNKLIGDWIRDHPNIKLVTFQEAVKESGDLLVFAMNGHAAFESLDAVGKDLLHDKILIDISNPLDFSQGFPPSLFVSNTDSLGEQIQKAYPALKVVKTLNTMSNPVMVNPGIVEGDHTVFVSGNDQEAKSRVSEWLISLGWKENHILDLGDITTARGTEMILPLWLRIYHNLKSPYFNFHINVSTKAG